MFFNYPQLINFFVIIDILHDSNSKYTQPNPIQRRFHAPYSGTATGEQRAARA